MIRETHTIDATDKSVGRLATQVVALLRGKNKCDFAPHKDMGDIVVIKNMNKVKFTGKKFEQKKYMRHSGYLGGLKEMPLKKLFKKDSGEILKKAVFGMLPKNRLRANMLKRLKFIK